MTMPLGILLAGAALLAAPVAASARGQDRAGSEGDTGTQRRIRWMAWERQAFEHAARLRRPVLLYLKAADCRLCSVIERDVFDHPEVVSLVAEHVVPVAADIDLRPDLASRYIIGTVPTISYLLPNGEPMYRIEESSSLQRVGAYMTDPERFGRYLRLAVAYMNEHSLELFSKAKEVAALEAKLRGYAPGAPPLERLPDLRSQMRDRLDYTYGGFGRGWKTLQDAPFRLFRILAANAEEDPLGKATLKTARSILSGAIHDEVEGGFHHYATNRDWSVPAREKRLDVNARALRLLVAAGGLSPQDEVIRDGVASTAAFLLDHLALADGGFALSQRGSLGPDDPGTYFMSDADQRQTLRPPPLEERLIAAYNAEAAVALLEAGALLGRVDLESAGLGTVDWLAERFYRKGRGLARTLDERGRVQSPGFLSDQVSGIEAFLAAYQVRGRPSDLTLALELVEFCQVNLLRDPGYFIDRVEDAASVGKLRRPIIHWGVNGRMALAMLRMAALTGSSKLRTASTAAVGALAAAVPKMTEGDAPYAEALLALASPPVWVVVPDGMEDVEALALRRAALLLPVAGVLVVPLEPDPNSPPARGLMAPEERPGPGAWVCDGTDCVGPVGEPAELLPMVERLRRVD